MIGALLVLLAGTALFAWMNRDRRTPHQRELEAAYEFLREFHSVDISAVEGPHFSIEAWEIEYVPANGSVADRFSVALNDAELLALASELRGGAPIEPALRRFSNRAGAQG